MFKVCARTVLALGEELISSDIIAFYELIKNAFDAKSENGVEIHFEITLRRNDYMKLRTMASRGTVDLATLKNDVFAVLHKPGSQDSLDHFRQSIDQAEDIDSFVAILDEAYMNENRIIVSDTGTGMSQKELIDNFLSIGTASRKRAVDEALADRSSTDTSVPYLGEKGIGRLSAMRLGRRLTVETARKEDRHLNFLTIDWSEFDNLDKTIDDIQFAPKKGDPKTDPDWSGTRLIIDNLSADWTLQRVKDLCKKDFSRLTDPFQHFLNRPRIRVFWNKNQIAIPFMNSDLLSHAHASVKGQYTNGTSPPEFRCTVEALDLGFDHLHEIDQFILSGDDLEGMISGTSKTLLPSVLNDLGNFKFEAYWFNRKRLKGIDSIGTQKEVRDLHRQWSGILLYRDGFRVFPYGEDNDDWLSLDRRALASSGYLLNKTQFIGRIEISRRGNPYLVDQTNRQGLRVCPEQQAFLDLLHNAIQERLRLFLMEIKKRYKLPIVDLHDLASDLTSLEDRASTSLDKIKEIAPDSKQIVNELHQILFQIKKTVSRNESVLLAELKQSKLEHQQLIQMAGVGLLIEVVVHELARATNVSLSNIDLLRRKNDTEKIPELLSNLYSHMQTINKRIRILDHMSVSGRQRQEEFSLNRLIENVIDTHEWQFNHYDIVIHTYFDDSFVLVNAVRGMIVQIIENLISNSIYWLELRSQQEPTFKPQISISLKTDPVRIIYEDNGPGIALENREKIFQPFFSLKESSKRRGLGLYIARECAEYHGGSLVLEKPVSSKTQRLHTFNLSFPDTVVA
ncbi:MAG: sensor histidine kinase [Bacteroidetes bacterium]|nr:sensor histidine kinase [Bacteroidota bacterium]MCY4223899.1 sensor histidine kinase [Bacteroidota bacterium]